jgi:hypothetical protein
LLTLKSEPFSWAELPWISRSNEQISRFWGYGQATLANTDFFNRIGHKRTNTTKLRWPIQTYIDVLMRNQLMPELGLSIVDGFSGGAIYHDGVGGHHIGSSVIALEAIQASEVRNNISTVPSVHSTTSST